MNIKGSSFTIYTFLINIFAEAGHCRMSRVFANGPGDRGSIPGRVIPTTQKMVLDAPLLSTQHYKVRIKGKVEQCRERSSAPTLHIGVVAIEKGAFGLPSTKVWFVWFYGISTFVGYFTPNPFLCK